MSIFSKIMGAIFGSSAEAAPAGGGAAAGGAATVDVTAILDAAVKAKGEKLDAVAKRFGMTTARLKQLNGINARTKVVPGFALLVPGKDAAGHESLAARLPQTPAAPPKATKWKKGKAGKSGAKPKGKAVNVKIRKPKKR